MKKNFISAMYVLNIVGQCIFSLLVPMLLMLALTWLFVSKLAAPSWLYAVLVPIGAVAGIISMIKFAVTASDNLTRLENQKKQRKDGKDKHE